MNFKEAVCAMIDGKKVWRGDSSRVCTFRPCGYFVEDIDGEEDDEDFCFTKDEIKSVSWKIHKEPSPLINFEEAVKALKAGKRIRLQCWAEEGRYLWLNTGTNRIEDRSENLHNKKEEYLYIPVYWTLNDNWQVLPETDSQ
jgi:hypothetical protein